MRSETLLVAIGLCLLLVISGCPSASSGTAPAGDQPAAAEPTAVDAAAQLSATALLSLEFNLNVPELQDAKVREAIFRAINREKIARDLYDGQVELPTSPLPAAIAMNLNNESWAERWAFDLSTAESLLYEAGYPSGLTLNLYYTEEFQSLAEIISQDLGRIGIRVTPMLLSSEQFQTQKGNGELQGIYIVRVDLSLDDPLGTDICTPCGGSPPGSYIGENESIFEGVDTLSEVVLPRPNEANSVDREQFINVVNQYAEDWARVWIAYVPR